MNKIRFRLIDGLIGRILCLKFDIIQHTTHESSEGAWHSKKSIHDAWHIVKAVVDRVVWSTLVRDCACEQRRNESCTELVSGRIYKGFMHRARI